MESVKLLFYICFVKYKISYRTMFDMYYIVYYRSAVKESEEWPSKYSKFFVEVEEFIIFFLITDRHPNNVLQSQ